MGYDLERSMGREQPLSVLPGVERVTSGQAGRLRV